MELPPTLGIVHHSGRVAVEVRRMVSALTLEALHKFLALLDADRERAGERYEQIRHKLIVFFECNGSTVADELADDVIDRAARRRDEGVVIEDLNRYLFGVARRVLSERRKHAGARLSSIDDVNPHTTSIKRLDERLNGASKDDYIQREHLLTCMERCLQSLSPETRALVTEFYQGAKRARIDARLELARRLGMTRAALGIRIHRIRKSLNACLDDCVSRGRYP